MSGSGGCDAAVVFCQADDGMRDLTVTGVQTCALPICKPAAGWIDTTTERTYLNVAPGYLPHGVMKIVGTFSWLLDWLFPNAFSSGGLHIGPIPKEIGRASCRERV